MLRETSLMSYMELLPELGERQLLVYEHIKKVPFLTAREIANNIGFSDPNSVRPRITELQNLGLIIAFDKRKCRISGKTVLTWGVL